jgi:hypothetical protein
VLPRKTLNIEYVETAANVSRINNSSKMTEDFANGIFPDWQISQNSLEQYQGRHDRYLVIDNAMEIMLSSGFDYLWNDNKEITCVFRLIS